MEKVMQAHHHYYHFGAGLSSPAGKYKALSNASQPEVWKGSGTGNLIIYPGI